MLLIFVFTKDYGLHPTISPDHYACEYLNV